MNEVKGKKGRKKKDGFCLLFIDMLNLCSFWVLSQTFFLPTVSICRVIFSRESSGI